MGQGAATELRFTMRPRPAWRIWGMTALFIRTMPKKFTSNRDLASSVEVNSTAPEIPKPALFTRMSMRPSRAMICSTAARTDSSLVTSAEMWCRPSTPCARRDSSYTVQPASFSASAVV